MKRAVFFGLMIALISSIASYVAIKNDLLDLPLSKILLLLGSEETSKSIDKMCSKSPKNLVEFYKKTGPDYKYNIKNKGSKTILRIADNLFSSQGIKWGKEAFNFIFENGLLIFFFILIIMLALLWIPFTCCICCRICICIPQKMLTNYKYYIYACLILCLGVLISCCVGFSKNSSLIHGIYGFGCSFLKITHHIINGDDYKVKPYWSGITPIVGKLNGTVKNITDLAEIVADTNTKVDNIRDIFSSFSQSLDDEYELRKAQKIPNPVPNEEDLNLEYIDLYGPTTDPDTSLGKIQQNLTNFESLAFGFFGDIIGVISLSNDTRNSLVNNFNKIIQRLEDGVDSIDKEIGDGIGKIDDVFDDLDGFVRIFMNVLFAINLGLIIFVALSLLCLFRKRGHCCLCFSWFFLYILMFLTICLGLVFLVIGLLFQNLSVGILYFIQNINDKVNSDFPEIARNILDCCFNGDGLLFNSNLIPEEFNSTVVELIYGLESSIKVDIQNLENLKFESIDLAQKQYKDFENNPKTYISQLQISLDIISKYIDIDAEGTFVNSDTPIKDKWVLDKKECPEGYDYYPSENNNTNNLKTRNLLFTETQKLCLVITEWDVDSIKERYKEIDSADGTIDISQTTGSYFISITECLNSYNANVKEMEKKNGDFNENFNYLKGNSTQILDNILKFIRPLRESYSEIVGEGSIFQILNCNFMKRDFNKLLQEIYEEFGNSFRKTSDIFLTVCIFQIVMTFLLLFIIAAIRKDSNNIFENNDQYALKDIKEEKLTDD